MDSTTLRTINTTMIPGNGYNNGFGSAGQANTAFNVRDLNALIRQESAFIAELLTEINKVMVGQEALVERVLIGLLADGHILLEGVPGLAKTLLVKTLAQAIDGGFARIQFTPDLLPADLIGTQIYNPRTASSASITGRSSPTSSWPTRSTARRPRCRAPCWRPCRNARSPSATRPSRWPTSSWCWPRRIPSSRKGTYPLPEAQVDRFMLKVKVDYPTRAEERLILDRMTGAETAVGAGRWSSRQICCMPARWSSRSTWTTRSRSTCSTWSSAPASRATMGLAT